MKKKVLLIASMALIATLSVKSTVAYLNSQTETIVNTMEMGNVSIKQLEYERVVDENGNWVSAGTEKDKYGFYPEKLQEFTQNKALFPAVFADGDIKWDDRTGSSKAEEGAHQQSWGQIGAPGSNQLFDDSVKNVIDKFVFVENDGENDAYVRTWFAFEQGSIDADNYEDVIMTNYNKSWWEWDKEVARDVVIKDENGVESKYILRCAVFKGSDSSHTGILEPNTITRPSLLQVYMKPGATNEDVKAIDGNGNGKFDILVLSQAVQTAGFSDAKTALDAAFGEATAENHPFNK